jgi:hypothetical protein
MSRKISKTSLTKHTKLLNELFKEFNITPTSEADKKKLFGHYTFQMQTKYGLLWLHPDSEVGSGVYTVYTRFDDTTKLPKELETITPCTIYNGKMNFHFSDGEFCVGALRHALNIIKRENP